MFRLEAYDRNANFTNAAFVVDTTQESVNIEWPTNLQYRQLTTHHRSVVPAISMDSVERYFMELPTASGSAKSVEKGHRLVAAERVCACSYALHDDNIYLTGIVRAAQRKKV